MSQDAALTAKDTYLFVQRQSFFFACLCLMLSLIGVAIFEPQVLRDPGLELKTLTSRVGGASVDFDWNIASLLLVMSFGAGLIGGMLGMGGGVLKVAGLIVVFKLDIYFARAVSIAAMFFMSLSALPQYLRQDLILWDMVRPCILPSVVSILIGILLGNFLGGEILTHLFGFFVIFLSFMTMGQTILDPQEKKLEQVFVRDAPVENKRKGVLYFIGTMHGFLCGLFGISGGIHTIPAQQVFLGVPIRCAIANTLAISTACAGVGCILVSVIGVHQGDFTLRQILLAFACVAMGASCGAQLGVYLSGRIDTHMLRFLVEIVGLAAGFSIVL